MRILTLNTHSYMEDNFESKYNTLIECLKKEEFDIMKYFCKNGIDIEKFYKFKNTVNYKKILEGIQIYNKYNNKEDKELEKLKLLIKLEGE